MKQILIIFACIFIGLGAYAKPHCQSFNNYDNKVTIVFTDDDAGKKYEISDVKLHTCGRVYGATHIKKEVSDKGVTVTLTFPYLTRFSNPKVTLRVNGKK